jgi:hypothetical protein
MKDRTIQHLKHPPIHYEEEIVNGVFSWRTKEDGDWTPFSIEDISEILVSAKEVSNIYVDKFRRIKAIVDEGYIVPESLADSIKRDIAELKDLLEK